MIASPTPPESPAPDPLAGLLVALNLRGITLRIAEDGTHFTARPSSALDPDTRRLLSESRAALLVYLAQPAAVQRERLLAGYEAVLWSVGRQWQVARDRKPLESEGPAICDGMVKAMERYAALSEESL